ncbi:MAG: DNA-binding protein [Mobilicoccus sp.]|nr:DNA-binding protein [Mobilicoccus sp.]
MTLRQRLRRLVGGSSVDVADAAAAREDLGGVPIGEVTDRARVVVVGVVRALRLPPADGSPHLVAELDDGSGTLDLVWLGRRSVPGIDPGVRLRAEGRVSRVAGRATLHNVRYDILP